MTPASEGYQFLHVFHSNTIQPYQPPHTKTLFKGPIIIYGREGPGSKVGGGIEFLLPGKEMGIEKKMRSLVWASKYSFLPRLLIPCENAINLHIYSTLKYMNILHQEWASKFFCVMPSGQ